MTLNNLSTFARLIAISTVLVLPLAAHAGEITRQDASKDFQWKTTECLRPIAQRAGPAESSQDRIVRYARDIEIYIDCIQREAQRDFQEAQRKMQEAIERDLEKQTEIMNDMMLNAAKTMR